MELHHRFKAKGKLLNTELGKNLSCQEDRHGYKQQYIKQVCYQGNQISPFQNALAWQDRYSQALA
jgi:hypothetical protein